MPARVLSAPWILATRARAALYGANWLARRRLELPTISVGALEMGGTGKSPAVAMLAELLRHRGHRPAIVSRGYGRQGNAPLLVSDGSGARVSVRAAGDEPSWYALTLPGVIVAVAGPREQGARLAAQAGRPDLYLLDDAFQHLRVERDVDLLMVDAERPFYRSYPPPAGRLREGAGAASRAHAFLVVGQSGRCAEELARRHPNRPVFELRQQELGPVPLGDLLAAHNLGSDAQPSSLPGPVLAFAGIARPERFWRSATGGGAEIVATRRFRDHRWYGADDLSRLARDAKHHGAVALLTTEKDAVRLAGTPLPDVPIYVWRYRLAAAHPDRLADWIELRLHPPTDPL